MNDYLNFEGVEETAFGYALNFRSRLLEESVEKVKFNVACDEWEHSDYRYSEHGEYCICKKNIHHCYYIINKNNGVELMIGSECCKHIGGDAEQEIKIGKKYADKFKKWYIKKYYYYPDLINKIFCDKYLKYLFVTIKFLNDWEWGFLTTLRGWNVKKVTQKQIDCLYKIVDKLKDKLGGSNWEKEGINSDSETN